MRSLVLGTGYVGNHVTRALADGGATVVQTSRLPRGGATHVADGAALDRLLDDEGWNQVVVCGQLTSDIDWMLERVDGKRWLVFSSQQLASAFPVPNATIAIARERFVLARGGCVLRPTMIYGRGGDNNVSRGARMIRRWRAAIVPGPGSQLVQPIHIDDLAALVLAHARYPASGLFAAAGPEPIPVLELAEILAEIAGVRAHFIVVPAAAAVIPFGRLLRLRPDQLRRLEESKVAVIEETSRQFRWEPEPLGIRLEQAFHEL